MHNIKTCNLVTFAMVLLLALFCFTSVYADDTSLGRTPDGVFPLQENDVIMESEEITVDLENNSVECIFVFHNTGKSKKVYMGFPGKLNNEEDGLTQDANLQIRNFKTFVKGNELAVIRENSTKLTTKTNNLQISDTLNYSEYYTFTVPFKANEKVTVRNTYDFTPTYDSIGGILSGYVLKTGAMWKGPIGSAKVTFKLGSIQPYQFEQLKPGGFRFVGNNLVWERNNFEPYYDLRLYYNTYRYSSKDLSNLTDDVEKLKQEIKQKIDSYNNVKELANNGQTDILVELYNKAITEMDSVLATYIRSHLPSDKIADETPKIGNINIDSEQGIYYIGFDILGSEPALTQLTISHIENGNEIIDIEADERSASFIRLTTGGEYIITCTAKDWLDRTEQKTLKYKVPVQAEELSENQVKPSDTISESVSSDPSMNLAATNDSLSQSVNGLAEESTNNDNYTALRPIIWVLSGIVLVGLIFVTIMLVRKKKQ